MSTRRIPRGRELVLGLSLIGFLGLTSGCGDENPVEAVGPAVAKAKGEGVKRAREQAYGKGGMPGRPAAATKP